jgi:hypothetical protein
MIKDRVLHIGVVEAVAAFAGTKWKFFDYELEEEGIVTIEVPRGVSEAFIVELPYANVEQRNKITEKLKNSNFIHQTVRIRSEW